MLIKKLIYLIALVLITVGISLTQDYPPSGLEEMVKEYQKDLVSFKKMDFKQPVGVVTVTPQEEQEFYTQAVDKARNQLQGLSKFLDKLGLVSRRVNILGFMDKFYTEHSNASYDSRTNAIRLRITPEELLIIRKMSDRQKWESIWPTWETTFIHELTHALQYQHSDFSRFELVNNDVGLAIGAVCEGEADLAGYYYSLKKYAGRHIKSGGAGLGMDFSSGGSKIDLGHGRKTSRDRERDQIRMIKSSLSKIARHMDKNWKRKRSVSGGVRSSQSASEYFRCHRYFSYIKGLVFIHKQYKKDGWERINKLYDEPPLSTEQILHPKKYQRDFPQQINLPQLNPVLGDDWHPVYQHIMGELDVEILFRCLLPKGKPSKIAEGWDGDTAQLFENSKTNQLLLIWFTTWDTQRDAREFFSSYQQIIDLKYEEEKLLPSADKNIIQWSTEQDQVWLEVRKSDVLVIEGVPAERLEQLKNQLWESTAKKEIKNINEFK